MPPFINKSWPILLLPLWWAFWILGLIFHNCYILTRNFYKRVKPSIRREPGAEAVKKCHKKRKKPHKKKKKEEKS